MLMGSVAETFFFYTARRMSLANIAFWGEGRSFQQKTVVKFRCVWRVTMFNGSTTCYRAAGLRVTRLNQGIQVEGNHGRLEYFVLPVDGSNKKKTTNMNGQSYNVLIKSHFPV